METNKRNMSIEEFIDYSKQFFSDRKFIDNVAKFSIDESKSHAEKKADDQTTGEEESPYKIFVSLDKLVMLQEALEKLPLVI